MQTKPVFAPQLTIRNGVKDISFYNKAFGAVELRRWSNTDETIHVAELSINGAIFHLHEETKNSKALSPENYKATTVTIGLMVDDVHAVVASAVEAGAIVISPVQDYDYGYRQGTIEDLFGHYWLIEKVI